MTMTLQEFAAAGGRSRWKNKNAKERSEAMKKVRNAGKKVIHTYPLTT